MQDSRRADVLVVGGGFQGLSAALHLAEGGADVVLLEAETPGHGASGRNGGQVIPGLKDDPDALDALHGAETTAFAGATAQTLFDLVDRLGIDCDPVRGGWIQAASRRKHLPGLRSRMEQWQARGAPVEWLDARDMSERIGSDVFHGGWLDKRAGKIHPLKLACGLAVAASAAGAQIHGTSPVARLERQGGLWRARTKGGAEVTADRVILATNAYTTRRFFPALSQTIVPANSFQLATAPLSDAQLSRILPSGAAVSESRRVGTYFRTGPENRLLIGGRGSFADPGSASDFRRLEAELAAIFGPGFEVTHRWFGRVGMTPDHRIRLCEPEPGLMAGIGFNGRGVALAVSLGRALAQNHLQGTRLPFPVETRPKRLPLHGLHAVYGGVAIHYYRLRDALES
ncbi:FAD-dependent oxidoreductase [Salipiger mucosus]|uniref:NAD(P)/FAD-dependent oxidoreductase n=1 Tax=Salipiger mucosus TaxID=263378 RepID=UPI0018DDEBD5